LTANLGLLFLHFALHRHELGAGFRISLDELAGALGHFPLQLGHLFVLFGLPLHALGSPLGQPFVVLVTSSGQQRRRGEAAGGWPASVARPFARRFPIPIGRFYWGGQQSGHRRAEAVTIALRSWRPLLPQRPPRDSIGRSTLDFPQKAERSRWELCDNDMWA